MSSALVDVVVVGAGVIGLTTAYRLCQNGYSVSVLTKDDPMDTTSAVAGAFWLPYLVPDSDVDRWGLSTHDVLAKMASDGQGSTHGVVWRNLILYLKEKDEVDPQWSPKVRGFKRLSGPLPSGFVDGFTMQCPLVVMPVFMKWLLRELAQKFGVVPQKREVSEASTLLQDGSGVNWRQRANRVVINCAGNGARDTAGDGTMVGVRGQIVLAKLLALPKSLDRQTIICCADPYYPIYIIPRLTDVVIGGTSDRANTQKEPDVEVAKGILQRADPWLKGAFGDGSENRSGISHRVGFRPYRPDGVRLGLEKVSNRSEGVVIHNYGHAGSGATLMWGCADDVVNLTKEVLPLKKATASKL
jgi:D-amino-acid oxidase